MSGIRTAVRQSLVRAIEHGNLPLLVRTTALITVSVILMIGGLVIASGGNAAGATATYVAAVFCLVFAFLSQFKKFSGLGFTGETWERKMEEADELIGRLKGLAAVVADPLFMVAARLGRWDQALSRREQYELVSRLENELTRNGVPASDIEKSKADLHRYTMIDLARPIIEGIRHELEPKLKERQRLLEAFPQPISITPEYNATVEAWRQASSAAAELRALYKVRLASKLPEAIRLVLADCPLFTEEEKTELRERLTEEFADLEYYNQHRQFRRLDVWLAGDATE